MMKQDYLWDKTGEDSEIEELENALAAFRYQEIAPPTLPAKFPPFAEKAGAKIRSRKFSFTLAFAACAAIVLILFGDWFQISNDKTAVLGDSAKTIVPQLNQVIQKDSIVGQPEVLSTEKVETTKRFAKPNFIKIHQSVPAGFRRSKAIATNTEINKQIKKQIKKPTVMLTEEEKYAYNQLLLALSITSSKLKIVKDKIDGVEEPNSYLKDGR